MFKKTLLIDQIKSAKILGKSDLLIEDKKFLTLMGEQTLTNGFLDSVVSESWHHEKDYSIYDFAKDYVFCGWADAPENYAEKHPDLMTVHDSLFELVKYSPDAKLPHPLENFVFILVNIEDIYEHEVYPQTLGDLDADFTCDHEYWMDFLDDHDDLKRLFREYAKHHSENPRWR